MANGLCRQLRGELIDRFGSPPAPAQRMLSLAALKIDAAAWQIREIRREEGYVVFIYDDVGRIRQLVELQTRPLRIADGRSAYLPVKGNDTGPDDLLEVVQSVLRPKQSSRYTPAARMGCS